MIRMGKKKKRKIGDCVRPEWSLAFAMKSRDTYFSHHHTHYGNKYIWIKLLLSVFVHICCWTLITRLAFCPSQLILTNYFVYYQSVIRVGIHWQFYFFIFINENSWLIERAYISLTFPYNWTIIIIARVV